MTGDSYVALATISAAFLSGLVSIVNLTIAKEHKISELRQAWIDSIRNDLANLIAMYVTVLNSFICDKSKKNGNIDYVEFYEKHISSISSATELHHRIILRLNNTKEHEKIIAMLTDIEYSIVDLERLKNTNEMKYLFDELNNLSQILLKKEWERVKHGEPSFNKMKKFALTLIFIPALYILYKLPLILSQLS